MNEIWIKILFTTAALTACGIQRAPETGDPVARRSPLSRNAGVAPDQMSANISFSLEESIADDFGLLGYSAVASDLVVETIDKCGMTKTTVTSPTNPAKNVMVCGNMFPTYPVLAKVSLKITGPNSVRTYILDFANPAAFPKELKVDRRVDGTNIIYTIRDKGGDLVAYADIERYFVNSSVLVEYDDQSFLSELRITQPSASETKVEFVKCPTCAMDAPANLPAGFSANRQPGFVTYSYASCDAGTYALVGTVRPAPGSSDSIKVTIHINVKNVNTTTKLRLFATSKLYKGNFGGITVADNECNTLATAAGVGGRWKAILSDNTTNARDRLSINAPIVDMKGNLLANNAADLWDGSIAREIRFTEKSTEVTWHLVYTGTRANGERDQRQVALNCGTSKTGPAWSSLTSPAGVETGRTDRKDAGWLAIYDTGTQAANSCGNDGMLYCLEQ